MDDKRYEIIYHSGDKLESGKGRGGGATTCSVRFLSNVTAFTPTFSFDFEISMETWLSGLLGYIFSSNFRNALFLYAF